MGNNNSLPSNLRGNSIIETSINSNVNKAHKKTELDENDLKLVRVSWNQVKCSIDFKTIGANLMVK